MLRRSFIALMALVVVYSSASARIIAPWSYERLFKEADIVVIATAQSVAPSDVSTRIEPLNNTFQGQVTTFAVQGVLKGKLKDGPLEVFHFKAGGGNNGPGFVNFQIKPSPIGPNGAIRFMPPESFSAPDYLLFLKLGNHGYYEPVAGQMDPDLSVRAMYSPFSVPQNGQERAPNPPVK